MTQFNLAEARINAGLSIKDLSKVCKVHEHSVRALEGGKPVHPGTAKKVADYFGVKVTDLASFAGASA